MKKKSNMLPSNKVPVVLGFRMMQSIYSPLLKFYGDMSKRGYYDYCNMTVKFICDAMQRCDIRDAVYFFDCNYSYTINTVCRDIFNLYTKYRDKVGDRYFLALKKLLECVRKDMVDKYGVL